MVNCQNPNQTCDVKNLTGGPLSYSNTFTDPSGNLAVTATASAAAGILKASASYSLSVPASFFTQFQAEATVADILTIHTGSLDGAMGFLQPTYNVTGTITPSALGDIVILWQDSVGTAPIARDAPPTGPGQGFVAGNAHLIFSDCFPFGQPLYLQTYFAAVTFPGPSILTGTADYSHTAVLTGLRVLDSSMIPTPNPTFTSALGAQYSLAWLVSRTLPAS